MQLVELPESITLTREEAAWHQIVAAIELFRRGRYECAITLGGAAEEMFPPDSASSFERQKTEPLPPELAHTDHARRSPDERGRALNQTRNWLKHEQPNEPVREIDQREAEMMVTRALTKVRNLDTPQWANESVRWFVLYMVESWR